MAWLDASTDLLQQQLHQQSSKLVTSDATVLLHKLLQNPLFWWLWGGGRSQTITRQLKNCCGVKSREQSGNRAGLLSASLVTGGAAFVPGFLVQKHRFPNNAIALCGFGQNLLSVMSSQNTSKTKCTRKEGKEDGSYHPQAKAVEIWWGLKPLLQKPN